MASRTGALIGNAIMQRHALSWDEAAREEREEGNTDTLYKPIHNLHILHLHSCYPDMQVYRKMFTAMR
jgi:hypothetical protein